MCSVKLSLADNLEAIARVGLSHPADQRRYLAQSLRIRLNIPACCLHWTRHAAEGRRDAYTVYA